MASESYSCGHSFQVRISGYGNREFIMPCPDCYESPLHEVVRRESA